MSQLNDCIQIYREQLEAKAVKIAYKGIIEFMMNLKSHLSRTYPAGYFPGNFHQGYMDHTYFSFTPSSLREQKLKICIGFNHEKMHFGIWLAGQNRVIQKKYWEIFKDSDWNKFNIPSAIDKDFSIVEHVITENPDFNDLIKLTKDIDSKAMLFIEEIKMVLQ